MDFLPDDGEIGRSDDEAHPSEPHTGLQGESGLGRDQGREDAGRVGAAVRCPPPQSNHAMERSASRRRGRYFRTWQSRGRASAGRAERAEPNPRTSAGTERTYPLGMVLSACPDIVDYAKGGIANWRDFLATAAVVRPTLGISPSAWEEARTVMGEAEAAVVVACLLQRSPTIQSAGGYLRELTRKAGRESSRWGPYSWPKLTRRTARGDPPEGSLVR